MSASDGAEVTRVRVRLAEPRVARVRSSHREIIVDFAPQASTPLDVAGAPPPRIPRPVGTRGQEPAPANALLAVTTEAVGDRTRVRLRGNGPLVPSSVDTAADLPRGS